MSDFFKGNNRLATFSVLAKPMRIGLPAQLAIPDDAVVMNELDNGNPALAREYSAFYHTEYQNIIAMLFEWSIQLPGTAQKVKADQQQQQILQAAYQDFFGLIDTINNTDSAEAGARSIAALLHPEKLNDTSAETYRQQVSQQQSTALNDWLIALNKLHATLDQAIANENLDHIKQAFNDHRQFALGGHDACIQFIQSYADTVHQRIDQASCEALLQQSFASCSFFEPLWSLGALPPDALAAYLAEHLRFHFSGDANRGGSVTVVEDEACYRLLMDACGSGGAMRRRLAEHKIPLSTLDPSHATWQKSQVPAYCAHCAFNEHSAIEKYGYPILVTQFNPDPNKPCEWTIYKDKQAIPEEYYTRIGKINA